MPDESETSYQNKKLLKNKLIQGYIKGEQEPTERTPNV